ncbi:dicarboxylate carrier 2 [Actinidia rufa]|uniref:Dicarboxylate carrier 2 n=1 Tax=Actinidia rufa TaxID=165716 RepID=A0A7J0GHP2_9ERIC|nr:dicarboxylate carrier 2 [Actinidia rufa]
MGVKGFVEGGIASIVAGCSTHPLDLVKVRMQLQGENSVPNPNHHIHSLRPAYAFNSAAAPGTLHIPTPPPPPPAATAGPVSVGIKIFQTEGVSALFLRRIRHRAPADPVLHDPDGALRDLQAEVVRSDPDSGTLSLGRKIAAGLVAGGIGAAVGNPADVAMVRMQADGRLPVSERRNYKSVFDAITRMSKQEGITSLWRGSSLTVNRAMIVTASQLASYDQVKEIILEKGLMKDGLGDPRHCKLRSWVRGIGGLEPR